jgi:U3 small nucleolar RNA-associated protein MPP10
MQMYEDEYRRKSEGTKENVNGNHMDVDDEQEEKLDPESEAIEREMNGVFSKLDALCHSRYRPSEQQVEPEVIVNKLAVNLEEVGQKAVTGPDEELLAPEEITKRAKFVPKSKEERDKTDKLRERRKKKQKQRAMKK